jgi:hypothetical protein
MIPLRVVIGGDDLNGIVLVLDGRPPSRLRVGEGWLFLSDGANRAPENHDGEYQEN